jgi:hypothetical protein
MYLSAILDFDHDLSCAYILMLIQHSALELKSIVSGSSNSVTESQTSCQDQIRHNPTPELDKYRRIIE